MQPTTINLLVAIRADAASGAGGADACAARFRRALVRANDALARSLTGVHLNAVGSFDLGAWPEFDPGAVLAACVDDRTQKVLRRARDNARADLVVVLAGPLLRARGKAYVMSRPDPRFERFAFAVVNVRALLGDSMTLAHEIGHLLGADHDMAHLEGEPPAGPAYGWQFSADGVCYRTIMSRAPGTLAPVYSSPQVLYQGTPCGTKQADNASVIRANAALVAAFR